MHAEETQSMYTMVTKEWSPLMLDHFEYSEVGIKVKPENSFIIDALGRANI